MNKVVQLISAAQPKPTIKASDFANVIGNKQVTQVLEEQFVCLQCKNIVFEPKECSNCYKWFCQACIVTHLNKGKNTNTAKNMNSNSFNLSMVQQIVFPASAFSSFVFSSLSHLCFVLYFHCWVSCKLLFVTITSIRCFPSFSLWCRFVYSYIHCRSFV